MPLHRSEFSVCKIIEFTLKSLKEILKALGLSQVVTKWKSLEDLMSPNTTKAFHYQILFLAKNCQLA